MMRINRIIDKFRFSLGFKINTLLAFIILLFILSSVHNHNLLNRFRDAYTEQIKLYYSIIELKTVFIEADTAINEYFKSGNRINLADFNNAYTRASSVIENMGSSINSDEAGYLLGSIDASFETYFSECSNAAFLYNTNNFNYYDKMYYAQSINRYLQKYSDELLQLLLADSMVVNEELARQHQILVMTNGGLIIFVIMLFFSAVAYLNLNVSKPLNDLVVQAGEMAKGNIDVKVQEGKTQNTISVLSKTFNEMAQSIKQMMENIHENLKVERQLFEEQLKNAEYVNLLNQATFLALQSQINPHFLFNTLNSISRTITLGKDDQAILMIDSLATLLRYSLTDAQVPVTLSKEIEITNEYLRIQKYRFSDRIQARIVLESGLNMDEIMLPRFTLQPLVENSIVHGLESKEEGGHITITIKHRGGYDIIKIGDDGVGIEKEKLMLIQSQPMDSNSNSIGIHNTQKRIQLFTGRTSSFKISSRRGSGTVIAIKLIHEEK